MQIGIYRTLLIGLLIGVEVLPVAARPAALGSPRTIAGSRVLMTGRLVLGNGPRSRGSPRRRRNGTVPATYAVSGYVSRRAGVRGRRRSCSSSHGASRGAGRAEVWVVTDVVHPPWCGWTKETAGAFPATLTANLWNLFKSHRGLGECTSVATWYTVCRTHHYWPVLLVVCSRLL